MPEPKIAQARNWSTKRRYEEAVKKVRLEGWTQAEAAKQYGVDRSHLNKKIKALEEEEKAAADAAAARLAEGRDHDPWIQQRRRIGTRTEFYQRYFGNTVCPDCEKHHEDPPHHLAMREVLASDAKRILINCPPYHSKSTEVTVRDTVYDICANPNSRTLIISQSLPFAQTFGYAIQDLLTNHELYEGAAGNLIEDYGPFKPSEDAVWSANRFYVAGRTTAEKDPTVQLLGVGGQIYGRRADKIKFDDIATTANQRNPEQVLKMLEWIDKMALNRIGAKKGQAIWVGTRVNAGDIYSYLQSRPGYEVLKFPAVVDEASQEMLWPDHFGYDQAVMYRGEMSPADFQLVFQQVDMPGMSASFPPELLEETYDTQRVVGHFDPSWRLVAGLDPAGPTKDSGYTSFTLMGVDLETGVRYIIDQQAFKSMKAPAMMEFMWEWTRQYPLFEWRVETNGIQAQLFQYNRELIQEMAKIGVRITPHKTGSNKWDPQFGVEGIAPLMSAGLWSIPWGNKPSQERMTPMVHEFASFPMGATSDRVMSTWFCEVGAKELLNRAHLPMFDQRMRVPDRVKRRRQLVSFEDRQIRRVPVGEQRLGHVTAAGNMRRQTVGTPSRILEEYGPEPEEQPMNIDPRIWLPGDPVNGG